jgi:nuclear transcription factor Y alpha
MAPGQYPYPDPYYRSIFAPPPQPYTGVHLQLMGVQQQGVPLPSDAVEEPVFVNAKQYHGILRRRQSRARLESQNKVIKSRKVRKLFLNRLLVMISYFICVNLESVFVAVFA